MSRTKKGSKGPGHEYWSKRPNSMSVPGKYSKNRTHRLERIQDKRLEADTGMEPCPVCDEMAFLDSTHYCSDCDSYVCECECAYEEFD